MIECKLFYWCLDYLSFAQMNDNVYHGWRKLVPRPRHPKANPEEQAAFKTVRAKIT